VCTWHTDSVQTFSRPAKVQRRSLRFANCEHGLHGRLPDQIVRKYVVTPKTGVFLDTNAPSRTLSRCRLQGRWLRQRDRATHRRRPKQIQGVRELRKTMLIYATSSFIRQHSNHQTRRTSGSARQCLEFRSDRASAARTVERDIPRGAIWRRSPFSEPAADEAGDQARDAVAASRFQRSGGHHFDIVPCQQSKGGF
jgi:hypothetical protein